MADDNPTRQRILDAALQLVVEDGVQAVTHRRVEERAGVARGSARYHFGSREDLLAALVGHLAERDHAMVAAAGLDQLADPAAGIADLVDALVADRDAALARFELYLYAARRPALREVVARWGRTFADVGARHLSGPEAPARAALISAAMDGVVLHALASPSPQRDEAAGQWIADLARR